MRAVYRTSRIVAVGIVAVVALSLQTTEAADPKPETLVESYARAGVALSNADAAMLTAQASFMQTMANIRKMTAETLMICEEVREKAMDNQVKTTQTYFGKRELRDQYLAKHPRVRPDLDTYRRVCSGPRRENVQQASYQSAQFARDGIRWPNLLQGPEFGQHRQELEILFAARPDTQSDRLQFQLKVDNVTRQMRDELKDKVHEVGQMEYVAAKNFITRLAFDARRVEPRPQSDQVAKNP